MDNKLKLNKKFLDKNLEGRIILEGVSRYAYLPKSPDLPELVLIFPEMPAEENGLAELLNVEHKTEIDKPDEKRLRYSEMYITLTTVAADDIYLKENKAYLEDNESFCIEP
jgi:hypothetical protein